MIGLACLALGLVVGLSVRSIARGGVSLDPVERVIARQPEAEQALLRAVNFELSGDRL